MTAAFPGPLQVPEIDAICTDDGEEVVPALASALEAGRPLTDAPALLVQAEGGWTATAPLPERTGLDAVPLPGDISEAQLARILGDMASLAFKWHKPLSARLLPVKDKKAGDHTDFKSQYLFNTTLRPAP